MSAPFYTDKIQYFSLNEKGRDYVVGDIHGRYDLVLQALRAVHFNIKTDRIFCVGDLIDRGDDSARVWKFLQQSYVFSIRGNHEDMLLELYAGEEEPPQAVLEFFASRNGLGWWLDVAQDERQIILDKLRKLPLMAEIETVRGNVGLVHADVPYGLSWQALKEQVLNDNSHVIEEVMWGRKRLSHQTELQVEGIGRVYVGHTPQQKMLKLANVVALDTGAVFDNHLTLVNMACATQVIHLAEKPDNQIQVIEHGENYPFSIHKEKI
jgi:serine/threonine protein phosphatase 1